MPLFLRTETNPGEAEWGAGPGGSGESLLLVIEIEGTGTVSAPAIDPSGRSNIVYIAGDDVNTIDVTLPAITETLTPIWRFTAVKPGITPTGVMFVNLIPAGLDSYVNLPPTNYWNFSVGEGEGGISPNPQSATVIHDGDELWGVFAGFGYFVTP